MTRKSLFFSLILCFIFAAQAQQMTGSLEGRVLDSQGFPLAAVNIIVSGPNMQGTRGTTTGERGYFRVLSLPPGMYSLHITHVAHHNVTIKNVIVSLGKTAAVGNVRLMERALEMPEVTVYGEQTVIDPVSTTYGGNINSADFEQLPIDRNYQSMISLLPQSNLSYYGDGVNIGGSTGFENKYFVDGVEVTDPLFNVFSTYLPYNFINEIELNAGGYEAEKNSALGGVVNVVTKSGTNEFHGSVFGFYTGNSFTENTELGLRDPTQGNFSDYDIGVNLGGPIIPNQLWYFAAYNPTFANHDVSIPDFGVGVDRTIRHLFAAKLNWLASQQFRFNLTVTGDPAQRDAVGRNVLAPPARLENPDVYLQDIHEGGVNISLNGSYSAGQNILIEGFIARVIRHDTGDPATEKGNELRFYDNIRNAWAGGVGVDWDSFRYSNSARIAVSILSSTHETSAGVQYKVNGTDNKYNYHNVILNQDSIYTEYLGKGFQAVSSRMPSFFVQDLWKISAKLRVSFGLKWDGQYIVGSDNKVDQKVTVPLQPRVGIILIPDDAGRNKIFGSYGRFSQELSLGTGMVYSDQGYDSAYVYPQDPRISREGGSVINGYRFSIAPEVKGLQGQYYDEFSLGYDRLIFNNIKISLQGLYRTLVQTIETGYSPAEQRLVSGNPSRYPLQDLPSALRDYAALIISIERYGDKHFNFLASYVLSRDYGNYEGLFDAFSHSEFPNQNLSLTNPSELNNINGLVPNDRTHVFKFSGSYKFLFGLTAGVTSIIQSGTPLSEYTTGSFYSGIRFLSKRGSAGRTPAIWDLNTRLTYELPMINFIHSRIILDLFHIASQQKAVDIDQRKYNVDFFGNPTGDNLTYGQAYRYQPAMSMRLGMEVSF
jgi:hypothetical protein